MDNESFVDLSSDIPDLSGNLALGAVQSVDNQLTVIDDFIIDCIFQSFFEG
jgi:hypothetical protein